MTHRRQLVLALAGLLLAVGLAWLFRYDVGRCESGVCYALDRWTQSPVAIYPDMIVRSFDYSP